MTVVHKGLTLQVGQTLAIDLGLSLLTAQETVAVTGEAPIVDMEKTEVSEVVSQNMVENLPLVGRRWDNFVLLTPGVTTDGNSVSFRGISSLYNNNSVDGANNNQAFFSSPRGGSTAPYVYSLDSIQEFQVSPSNYGAEFGQAAGGVVNGITKSGGNAVYGDLFYYLDAECARSRGESRRYLHTAGSSSSSSAAAAVRRQRGWTDSQGQIVLLFHLSRFAKSVPNQLQQYGAVSADVSRPSRRGAMCRRQ